MLETSLQARFMIPMAVSLAFGVVFSSFVLTILIPCLWLIGDDVSRLLRCTPVEGGPYPAAPETRAR